jgi:ParB-like chromosome segregation protein Spo0J
MGTGPCTQGQVVEVRELALADLVGRPGRCGTLPARSRRALERRLAGGGACPALIVRAHARRPGKYEILDGHSRAEVLGLLGRETIRCEVWAATDEEADVLAIALNHVRGRPDARGRALAARRVVRRLGEEAAAEELGLTVAGLRQWLRHLRGPQPQRSASTGLDLRAMVFHVTPHEAQVIGRKLREAGSPRGRRGEALARALSARPGADPL